MKMRGQVAHKKKSRGHVLRLFPEAIIGLPGIPYSRTDVNVPDLFGGGMIASGSQMPNIYEGENSTGADGQCISSREWQDQLSRSAFELTSIPKDIQDAIGLLNKDHQRSKVTSRDAVNHFPPGASLFSSAGNRGDNAGEKFKLAGFPPFGAEGTHSLAKKNEEEDERIASLLEPRTPLQFRMADTLQGKRVKLELESVGSKAAEAKMEGESGLDPDDLFSKKLKALRGDLTQASVKSFFDYMAKAHPDMKAVATQRLGLLRGELPAHMQGLNGNPPDLNPATQLDYAFPQADWQLLVGLKNISTVNPQAQVAGHYRLYEAHAIHNAAYNYIAQGLGEINPSSAYRCLNMQTAPPQNGAVDNRVVANFNHPAVRAAATILPDDNDPLYNENERYCLQDFHNEWKWGGPSYQTGWNKLPRAVQTALSADGTYDGFCHGSDKAYFQAMWPKIAEAVTACVCREVERFGVVPVKVNGRSLHELKEAPRGVTVNFDKCKTTLPQNVTALKQLLLALTPHPSALMRKAGKGSRATKIFGVELKMEQLGKETRRAVCALGIAARAYFCDGLLALLSDVYRMAPDTLTNYTGAVVPGPGGGPVGEEFVSPTKWLNFLFGMGGHSTVLAAMAQAFNANIFFAHQELTSSKQSGGGAKRAEKWTWYAPVKRSEALRQRLPAFFFVACADSITPVHPTGDPKDLVSTARVETKQLAPVTLPLHIFELMAPECAFVQDADGAIQVPGQKAQIDTAPTLAAATKPALEPQSKSNTFVRLTKTRDRLFRRWSAI